MHGPTSKPDIALGKYRHYKGNEYEVIGLACDEVTLDWLVLYKPLYTSEGPDCWARKYDIFFEEVNVNGEMQPRFRYIDNDGS